MKVAEHGQRQAMAVGVHQQPSRAFQVRESWAKRLQKKEDEGACAVCWHNSD